MVDKTLFIGKSKHIILIVQIYIDDIIFDTTNDAEQIQFKFKF